MTRVVIDSPVGPLLLAADAAGLREIRFLAAAEVADAGLGTDGGGAFAGRAHRGGIGRVHPHGESSPGAGAAPHAAAPAEAGAAVVAEAARQLHAYFAGERRDFDLPLAPRGTPFQLAVWRTLVAIPYGATTSYGEIAARIGRPRAVRAVGAANGANPLPIVVPCHRVIGSDGRLVGYGGGLPIKRALLALERGTPPGLPFG